MDRLRRAGVPALVIGTVPSTGDSALTHGSSIIKNGRYSYRTPMPCTCGSLRPARKVLSSRMCVSSCSGTLELAVRLHSASRKVSSDFTWRDIIADGSKSCTDSAIDSALFTWVSHAAARETFRKRLVAVGVQHAMSKSVECGELLDPFCSTQKQHRVQNRVRALQHT